MKIKLGKSFGSQFLSPEPDQIKMPVLSEVELDDKICNVFSNFVEIASRDQYVSLRYR